MKSHSRGAIVGSCGHINPPEIDWPGTALLTLTCAVCIWNGPSHKSLCSEIWNTTPSPLPFVIVESVGSITVPSQWLTINPKLTRVFVPSTREQLLTSPCQIGLLESST